jgi:hypothetical protein
MKERNEGCCLGELECFPLSFKSIARGRMGIQEAKSVRCGRIYQIRPHFFGTQEKLSEDDLSKQRLAHWSWDNGRF